MFFFATYLNKYGNYKNNFSNYYQKVVKNKKRCYNNTVNIFEFGEQIMNPVYKKIICFFFAASIVFSSAVCCVSCVAKESVTDKTTKEHNQQFKITVPRIIAAGSAIVLFTASQIIIQKKTSEE